MTILTRYILREAVKTFFITLAGFVMIYVLVDVFERVDNFIEAGAELRYLVETFEAAEASGNQNFRSLLDFSLGRIDDHAAMSALGIDSQEDLFLLMAQAHLPMPRLAEAVTQGMVDSLNALAS